jgi:formate hydrogenlyase subunit 6/NADH:ubiquinone oxidoreductase subunit I
MPGLLNRILKNMVSPSATRLYPREVREPFLDARGDLETDITRCKFCGKCARRCPANCLSVDKDAGLWQRDPFRCILCGSCVEACPNGCLRFVPRRMGPQTGLFTLRLTRESGEEAESG